MTQPSELRFTHMDNDTVEVRIFNEEGQSAGAIVLSVDDFIADFLIWLDDLDLLRQMVLLGVLKLKVALDKRKLVGQYEDTQT